MQEQEYEISIIISNIHDTSLNFAVEPWEMVYEMPPHASYTVVFRSFVQPVPPKTVEVEYGGDRIVVYAWDGCLYAIYHNGEALLPGAFVGPQTPAGIEILKNSGFLKATLNTSRTLKTELEEC